MYPKVSFHHGFLPWVRTVQFDIVVVVSEKEAFKSNLVVPGSSPPADLATCIFLKMHRAGTF